MTGYNWTSEVHPVEWPPQPGEAAPRAVWRIIAWDYFPAMYPHGRGTRVQRAGPSQVRAGRDRQRNVRTARIRQRLERDRPADGQHVGRGADTVEIVGVIADVRYLSLDSPPDSEIYRPLAQTFMFPMAFAVRTDGDPASLAAAVRRLALEVDGTIPVAEMQPLSSLIAGSLGKPRLLRCCSRSLPASGLR